ncbi:hypothetical protein MSAN_00175200 [Mycena sanguinolenta]|uniref:Uncharacterized protein n=1 Tax=Mycena sanguinolenta TaxID=230812 RepID=A0A8H7DNC6_9AGAR|nr:hypothetical protein MSAN_00175200 [Mycena sanguinolenta]
MDTIILGLWDNSLNFRDLLRPSYCTFAPYTRTIRRFDTSDVDDDHFQEIAADLQQLTDVVELFMLALVDPQCATAASFFATTPFPIIGLICLFPNLQKLDVSTSLGQLSDPSAAVPPQQLHRPVLLGPRF